jgi:hypothetical protein
MTWVAVIVLLVLIAVGIALWIRSRRRGGVIAAPPADGRSSPPTRDEP